MCLVCLGSSYLWKMGTLKKKKKNLMVIVGSEGSRGFGPFHLKPKAYAEEEEVPRDE